MQLHLFKGLFFQDRTGKLVPEKQNHSDKTNLDLLEQEIASCNGIISATYKSARRSREMTITAPHHSLFYRPDTIPATEPTALKHWKQ